MKEKIIIILIFTVISSQLAISQINGDDNWETSTPHFYDDFNSSGRSWVNGSWFDNPNYLWRAHFSESCVTHGTAEHMVYQRENALFSDYTNSNILLRATFYDDEPMDCFDYTWPDYCSCDISHPSLYYKSGAIEAITPDLGLFLYGYFEIRCKLPVHRGAFPAFWLWNCTSNVYEEIDIFEYSWQITYDYNNLGSPSLFASTVWSGACGSQSILYTVPYTIPQIYPDLSDWHVFAAEWSPERLIFYIDNLPFGEINSSSVPSHPMRLKVNYALDNWVIDGEPIYTGFPHDMTVDYVRVNKLKCDCDADAVIQNNLQLAAYDYKVKKTITVGGYGYSISVPNNDKVVLRATDGITINGDFEVPLGSELDLITHACPE